MATLVGLSRYHFCRSFKQSLGITPHKYHIRLRIERAKALLAEPASSVTDVGLMLGFSDTSSFISAFRKSTRVTPTEYRQCLE
jgi:AraC family transcriptional regulator